MSVSVNAAAALNGAGAFATSRRGAVGYEEIAHARSVLGDRATAAQVAKMIGRCEADVRPMMKCRNEVDAILLEQAKERDQEIRRQEAAEARKQAVDETFRQAWAKRDPTRIMAERFNMSPNAIRLWADRLGLPRRSERSDEVEWTSELDEIVRSEFVAKRVPASVVAAQIPRATKSAVIGRAFRLGLCRGQSQQAAA